MKASADGHLLPSPPFCFEVLRSLAVTAYVEMYALELLVPAGNGSCIEFENPPHRFQW